MHRLPLMSKSALSQTASLRQFQDTGNRGALAGRAAVDEAGAAGHPATGLAWPQPLRRAPRDGAVVRLAKPVHAGEEMLGCRAVPEFHLHIAMKMMQCLLSTSDRHSDASSSVQSRARCRSSPLLRQGIEELNAGLRDLAKADKQVSPHHMSSCMPSNPADCC